MRSGHSLGFTALMLWAITACGGSSPSPAALAPASSSGSVTGVVENGILTLAEPVVDTYAAQLRVDVTGAATLPTELTILNSTFSQYSAVQVPGSASYGVVLTDAFNSLSFDQLALPLSDGVEVSVTLLAAATPEDATNLIYLRDPNQVTIQDVALVLAAVQDSDASAPELQTQVNELLDDNAIPLPFLIDPLPSEVTANYVVGPLSPGLDIIDVAAVLAAIQVEPVTPETLAARINEILDFNGAITADDIAAIPGSGSVSGFTIPPLPDPTFAGTVAISVVGTDATPLDFTLTGSNGTAVFSQRPVDTVPGFTSYFTDLDSAFVNLTGVTEAFNLGITADDCVIFHPVTTDPALADNQLSRTLCLPNITLVDDTSGVGSDTSIAIGVDGLPVISYYDQDQGDLKVAKCRDTACEMTVVTTLDAVGNVGSFTSIAIGDDSLPIISYFDATNQDLKVAKCNDINCLSATLATVDAEGDVGTDTSITMAASGLPIISYRDGSNQDLKVAVCQDPSCTTATFTTFDTPANDGFFTSIGVGEDGIPVISFYNGSLLGGLDLNVARCFNATCVNGFITTVDEDGDVGQFSSLAIGSDGLPVISYYDATNLELKFAKCLNASCSLSRTTTVASSLGAIGVGSFSSVAVARNGFPIISYYNNATSNLRVAQCEDLFCRRSTLATVDPLGRVGRFNDIATGADGFPVISYFDETTAGSLRVAKCNTEGCQL